MNTTTNREVSRKRTSRSRRLTMLAGVSSLALALSACGGGDANSDASDGEVGSVTVAVTTLASFLLPSIAASEGIDDENGVTIVPTEYTSTATEIPMVLSGEINVGVGGAADVLSAVAQGIPIKVIGTVASVAPETAEKSVVGLVTRDDSIETPADLAGKPIGVNSLKTYNTLSATAALMADGVAADEATFVAVPYASLPAAVEKQQVAAAVLQEPALTQALDSGARLVAGLGPDIGENSPANLYFVSAEWAASNADALAAVVASMQAVIERVSSDEEFLRAQVLKEIPVPVEVGDKMNLPTFSTDVPDETFDDLTALLKEIGYIENAPKAKDYVIRP